MTIQKKLLLEGLKLVLPGIETGNPTLQGSDSFVFHNGKIFSYNDLVSVTVPIEKAGLVEEDLEGAVKADEFFKVVNKFSSEEINFVTTENGTWILKCGKAKVEMTLQSFDFETRLNGISPSEEWVDVGNNLINGIGVCKLINNKTPLAGIYVSGKEIISTDGWQINKFNLENKLPTFWISDNSANELLKIKGIEKMQIQGSWVHFKTKDGIIFSIKTLDCSKFPVEKISRVIDNTKYTDTDVHATFPKELFNAVDRATSFSMEISDHNAVCLTLTPKNIEVSSERATGKYNEKVSWDKEVSEFEPVSLYIDAIMMTFMAQRTLDFYILKSPSEDVAPRLLFVSDSSTHLLSTFNNDKE